MRPRWIYLVLCLAILVPTFVCFGSAVSGARVFAYRDAAHFYYPLYSWINRQWKEGTIPLWNPQENTGVPLIAETTSAVFYPGKLIFLLPLDYAARYNLYIIIHVLLAAGAAYVLARSWRCSREAAGLCGVTYGFSGAVLFQYCNVVFLVGAAWLPVSLLAADRLLARRRIAWALALGITLACPVLGGDPQSAYHAGLIVGLYAILRRWSQATGQAAADSTQAVPWWRTAPVLLGFAAASGLLLAAVQILPAAAWTGASDRAAFARPRTLYEIPSFLARSPVGEEAGKRVGATASPPKWRAVCAGLFGPPVANTHHAQLYDFSLPPWRLLEMIWPNGAGRTFPHNRRWVAALHAERRIWTPSLYLGILPLLLGLGTWRLRGDDVRVRWLSWVVLLSGLASFGWFGPGWLVRAACSSWSGPGTGDAVGAPTGGLYWLMVVLLPGYTYFRFPAKLLMVTSLGLAGLSGIGLDRLVDDRRDRFQRRLFALGLSSLLAGGLVLISGPWWTTWMAGAKPDELYGPLDIRGGWCDAWTACLHTATLCALAWWLCRARGLGRKGLACLVLCLTALDLAWSNHWMIQTAPVSAMNAHSLLGGAEPDVPMQRVFRAPNRRWVPEPWLTTSSRQRSEETLRWDRATLFPNLHLLGPGGSILSASSLTARDYEAVIDAAGARPPCREFVDLLGADYLILPAAERWPATNPVASDGASPANARAWKNRQAYPRAWIVHRVSTRPPPTSSDPASLRRYTRNVLLRDGRFRDFRRMAVVECDREQVPAGVQVPRGVEQERCQVVKDEANTVTLRVSLAAPGLVVLNDFYYHGWVVDVSSHNSRPWRAPIERVNCVMRGVLLPAGDYRLEFQYTPAEFYCGAAISALSWLAAIVFFVCRVIRT